MAAGQESQTTERDDTRKGSRGSVAAHLPFQHLATKQCSKKLVDAVKDAQAVTAAPGARARRRRSQNRIPGTQLEAAPPRPRLLLRCGVRRGERHGCPGQPSQRGDVEPLVGELNGEDGALHEGCGASATRGEGARWSRYSPGSCQTVRHSQPSVLVCAAETATRRVHAPASPPVERFILTPDGNKKLQETNARYTPAPSTRPRPTSVGLCGRPSLFFPRRGRDRNNESRWPLLCHDLKIMKRPSWRRKTGWGSRPRKHLRGTRGRTRPFRP